MQSNLMRHRNLTHHCWSRLGHNPFSFFLFLNSFRHGNAANQDEIFGTVKRVEMAHVEPTKKMVPLITCEISLGQNVCELMFGVNVTDFDLGIQIDPVKQSIQSNSVGP